MDLISYNEENALCGKWGTKKNVVDQIKKDVDEAKSNWMQALLKHF